MDVVDKPTYQYAKQKFPNIIGWVPRIHADDGRPYFNTTQFVCADGRMVSVFSIKPVYYEALGGFWRPLSEITTYHGNKKIVLNEKWRLATPRFVDWLQKRQTLFGEKLLLPTPFGMSPYQNIVRPTVSIGLTTTTVYPDPNPETTTVDGYTESGNAAWATARTTGNAAVDSLNRMYVGFDGRGSTCFLRRVFTYFDTSSISSGDAISSATYSIYRRGGVGLVNDGLDYLTVVQVQGNNVVSDTALNALDHNDCGDAIDNPTEGIDTGDRYDISSGSTGVYVNYTLNSTGIGWIAKSGEAKPSGATSGITYLGIREGHDIENSNPLSTTNDNQVEFDSADETGTSNDPKLVVEHSAAANPTNVLFFGSGL